MKKKNETDALNEAIVLLELKRAEEFQLLKDQLEVIHESLNPISILKNAFQKVTSSSEIKNTLVSNTIGITTGLLTKNIFFRNSRNPIKKFIGNLLQFEVSNFVAKHSDDIKSIGGSIVKRLMKNKKDSKEELDLS